MGSYNEQMRHTTWTFYQRRRTKPNKPRERWITLTWCSTHSDISGFWLRERILQKSHSSWCSIGLTSRTIDRRPSGFEVSRSWLLLGILRSGKVSEAPNRGFFLVFNACCNRYLLFLTYFNVFGVKMFITRVGSIACYMVSEILVHYSGFRDLWQPLQWFSWLAIGNLKIPIPFDRQQEPQPKTTQLRPGIVYWRAD